jgi:hypothetical protein
MNEIQEKCSLCGCIMESCKFVTCLKCRENSEPNAKEISNLINFYNDLYKKSSKEITTYFKEINERRK